MGAEGLLRLELHNILVFADTVEVALERFTAYDPCSAQAAQ
jgi:hypothetical protein